eukprot:2971555-Amphidinium_carterae.1
MIKTALGRQQYYTTHTIVPVAGPVSHTFLSLGLGEGLSRNAYLICSGGWGRCCWVFVCEQRTNASSPDVQC